MHFLKLFLCIYSMINLVFSDHLKSRNSPWTCFLRWWSSVCQPSAWSPWSLSCSQRDFGRICPSTRIQGTPRTCGGHRYSSPRNGSAQMYKQSASAAIHIHSFNLSQLYCSTRLLEKYYFCYKIFTIITDITILKKH